MKIVCTLIRIFSLNVLVAQMDEYVKQVIITNLHIRQVAEQMAMMIAVPERETMNMTRSLMLDCQIHMQTEITTETGIRAPEINERYFKDVSLPELGLNRRDVSRPAIKALIRVILRGDNQDFKHFSAMCRLIGLYKSIIVPSSYVQSTIIYNGVCLLISENGSCRFRYKTVFGHISEVDEIGNVIELLYYQVQ
ncbi:uncharacterized protein LOC126835180 isoform X2 [Adelges cooleyi]|uniref:uncharacterized protein LOC126835180 isoform X2 n=1 Tax=Adelges cooleyi TaxID=133065 RepID=UPI0021801416|nr:uncharacterized protein LOC126835180 isoform X2 [Adelges cooleyi]